jgi:hypothetical protein
MTDAPLDGNATAGDLSDVFSFDTTTAITVCAACRRTQPIATLRAYLRAPGIVLRCSACDGVQIRFVRTVERAWLDLGGVAVLEIRGPLAGDGGADRATPAEGTRA